MKKNTFTGGKFTNEKGTIKFVNDFKLSKYKRFYAIEMPKKKIIRAFHGHIKESKAVYVASGSVLLNYVKLTDKINPSKKAKVNKIILKSESPQIVLIPKGFANGIMSLEKNTQVIFFSDKTVNESEKDDYRFSEDYWGEEIWK